MSELIPEGLQSWMDRFVSPLSDLLQEVEEYTKSNHPESHMLSGAQQGQFLSMISHMIRPRRVLEIGTFTGYSALCLASGLSEYGKLITLECRDTDAQTAQGYFDRCKSQIQLIQGNAQDILPTLTETWDLVFIDADKTGYLDYFNILLPSVRRNGFILADNIFFHGQVLDEPVKGKNAKALLAFAEAVKNCRDVQVPVPLRDGIMLIRKL